MRRKANFPRNNYQRKQLEKPPIVNQGKVMHPPLCGHNEASAWRDFLRLLLLWRMCNSIKTLEMTKCDLNGEFKVEW